MDADITLEQTQNGEVSGEEVICSGGMFPCIAIAVYNSKHKKVYMIHESNQVAGGGLTQMMIDEASQLMNELRNRTEQYSAMVNDNFPA